MVRMSKTPIQIKREMIKIRDRVEKIRGFNIILKKMNQRFNKYDIELRTLKNDNKMLRRKIQRLEKTQMYKSGSKQKLKKDDENEK